MAKRIDLAWYEDPLEWLARMQRESATRKKQEQNDRDKLLAKSAKPLVAKSSEVMRGR